eukprot:scaffold10972_cov127-Isochrysis_galbana.AAC.5
MLSADQTRAGAARVPGSLNPACRGALATLTAYVNRQLAEVGQVAHREDAAAHTAVGLKDAYAARGDRLGVDGQPPGRVDAAPAGADHSQLTVRRQRVMAAQRAVCDCHPQLGPPARLKQR